MRNALIIWLLSSAAAFAGENLRVAVCNVSQVPAAVVERAEAETTYVFRAMNVEVHWLGCGAEVGAADARMRPDFIVRIQLGGHITKAGPASLDAMGRAFMDDRGYGYMVDTYYDAIRNLAARFPYANDDQLLGYVVTHELGHLLIGTGHRPSGIMRASWGKGEMEELNKHHLKFNDWERAMILRKLSAR